MHIDAHIYSERYPAKISRLPHSPCVAGESESPQIDSDGERAMASPCRPFDRPCTATNASMPSTVQLPQHSLPAHWQGVDHLCITVQDTCNSVNGGLKVRRALPPNKSTLGRHRPRFIG